MVMVNGKARELPENATISELLELMGCQANQVVAEHNGRMVSRESFRETAVKDGDTVEIISFMGGG
ncbi:sulfur carrier protein ThiS [Lachnospiraceae bacterium 54-53]